MPDKANAIIYCERGMLSPLGKTAHGLIRHSERYRIVGVVDSTAEAGDAGEVLDGKKRGIPIFPSIEASVKEAKPSPKIMVVGLAPTGFKGERDVLLAAEEALGHNLSIHSGLHLFLSEVPHIRDAAAKRGLELIDIRKPPPRRLKMFSGDILSITTPRLLVTGQDAAVGKRTACIRLCKELGLRGIRACMIGTGQTAWLQGVEYGVRLDALPLDFAGGEIEAEIARAYTLEKPDVFVVEGQGSLLNPGYSCETMILLTACRPSMLIYLVAPGRSSYVDFPHFRTRSAEEEIEILERISGAPVVGIIVHGQTSGIPSSSATLTEVPSTTGADGDLGPIVDKIVALLRQSEHGLANLIG